MERIMLNCEGFLGAGGGEAKIFGGGRNKLNTLWTDHR